MLQGTFEGETGNTQSYHDYEFFFPDNGDRLTVSVVCGKPANSKGYLTYRLLKSGVRSSSNPKAKETYGSVRQHEHGTYKVYSTFQSIYDVKRGGKGNWGLEIRPHYDQTLNTDQSLKYGCVLTIESTKNLDVYSGILEWISTKSKPVAYIKNLVKQ